MFSEIIRDSRNTSPGGDGNGDRTTDRRAWFHGDAAARAGGLVELLYLPKTASDCQGPDRYCCAATGDRPEAARPLPDPTSRHRDPKPSHAFRRATEAATILLQRG